MVRTIKSFSIREDVLIKLEEQAKKENRSVSNMLETILLKALKNET